MILIHQAVTLPEIRTFPIFGWSSAMRGIIGESQYEVPQELQGNVDGIGLYVKRWLEEHDETLEECLSTKFFRSDLKQNYKSIFDN